jgi:alcohol dehydrogenase class IV
MRATGAPNGIGGVGYDERDLPALARGAFAQRRLVDNAPTPVDEAQLTALFAGALRYW